MPEIIDPSVAELSPSLYNAARIAGLNPAQAKFFNQMSSSMYGNSHWKSTFSGIPPFGFKVTPTTEQFGGIRDPSSINLK